MAPEQEATRRESQREPSVGSVYELLRAQTARFADNDLFVLPRNVQELWGLQESRWTYRQTLETVDMLAGRYRTAGYGAGHRVALLLENRPAHFFHWLALNAIGASAVPVNPDYTRDELSYLLKHSESALLICLASRRKQAEEAAKDCGIAIPLDENGPLPDCAVEAADRGPDADTECALIYTSGTTGRPKG